MGLGGTFRPSHLAANGENWVTSSDLCLSDLHFEPGIFLGSATHLLANPNLTSGHLFRADILFDSAGILKSPEEKERAVLGPQNNTTNAHDQLAVERLPAPDFDGYTLTRTILRRFIPRKKIDSELDQTCHFYSHKSFQDNQGIELERCLLIYLPHFSSEEQVPFYHPSIRALGFLYEFSAPVPNNAHSATTKGTGVLSLHFIPFSTGIPESIPYRLERTFLALLTAQVRLARSPAATSNPTGSNPRPFKDNIIPQHVVQTTYAKLKDKYASTLIRNWVEVTEPSKHVFEDISIAAFLIELWKKMYRPISLNGHDASEESGEGAASFPGFVDIACGNGVLVYLLREEGYTGWGFDARRRKSWETYPPSTQKCLKESICIPSIFRYASPTASQTIPANIETNDGIFKKGTFIISNHADELTIWTPLLGVLADPTSPLPFLSIPCCSHSISGARFRYPPPKRRSATTTSLSAETESLSEHDQNPQPATGDLKALRGMKYSEHDKLDISSSTYAALTAKLMSIATELGYDVEKTMMRIPSTRNIGVIGGLKAHKMNQEKSNSPRLGESEMETRVRQIVEREAEADNGLAAAARIWIERSMKLHRGQGSGSRRASECVREGQAARLGHEQLVKEQGPNLQKQALVASRLDVEAAKYLY
ncbi:predicted protein [Uncinocarpus reesii 1704]|uniref:tRNA (uracil-O(2)-)-methyltransferase n=1 Tax=Uncinocarpus reesii (strain UAMH 1704) TaxID=336963 RepID=C4JU26_UNCRE|nr:uncharacterized protein UREG_05965 [Uncinocarpus reesii 1704]EEP81123.1 predicted protein [Uncinocarpus reesii 1704]